MIKMNKFNITFYMKSTKQMKNAGANDVPQSSFSTQPGGVLLQSYMSMFQFSPVVMINNKRKLCPKSLKFLKSEMTFPDFRSEKKNTARIEKMNSASIRSKNTFASELTDSVIVCINALSPSFFDAILTTLVTLSTLSIRAI